MNSLIKRFKSYLLQQINDIWLHESRPFSGIIFFEKSNNELEAFECSDGLIIRPYVSPCLAGEIITQHLLIDTTEFCNEDEDEYGCGTIPQMYLNEKFHGMCFTFIDGKCDREYYTDVDGITLSNIEWAMQDYPKICIKHYQAFSFHLQFLDESRNYFYNGTEFSFKNYGCKYPVGGIDLKFNVQSNKITRFQLYDDILDTKAYLTCPISITRIFELIENHQNFIFDIQTRISLNELYAKVLFNEWIQNQSFRFVENLSIIGIENFESLLVFSDNMIFSSLKILYLSKETPKEMIEELKATNPNFEIKLLEFS